LRVILARCVVLAARRDLHEVAGKAFSASCTLFSASAFGTERQSAGVCDYGRRRSWKGALSIGSSDHCSDGKE
jgi:hypothetical protein